ncbi:MAG: retroviral-like aspartic protease family protein [Bacteroidota bacterium]
MSFHFTNIQYDHIAEIIYSMVKVSPVKQRETCIEVKALWDTVANVSCISNRMVGRLGLKEDNFVEVITASGLEVFFTYSLSLEISKDIWFPQLEVVEFRYGNDDHDLIIGMDILTQGDLAITNFEGKTLLSFRIPSVQRIDFGTFSA